MDAAVLQHELEKCDGILKELAARLGDYRMNSNSEISRLIAGFQLECLTESDRFLKSVKKRDMKISELHETEILLAEFAIDSDIYSLKYALREMVSAVFEQRKNG